MSSDPEPPGGRPRWFRIIAFVVVALSVVLFGGVVFVAVCAVLGMR